VALICLFVSLALPQPPARAANMTLNTVSGGNVSGALVNPLVWIDFWGSAWNSASTTNYEVYLTQFFGGIGQGPWMATQGQYGVGLPSSVLGGTWIDFFNSVPQTPSQDDINGEVEQAVAHFNLPSAANDIILIALPPGNGDAEFAAKGGPACAWHSWHAIGSVFGRSATFPVIALPYQTDAPTQCRQNSVNRVDDSYGHGTFDGVSVSAGHEYAETITDPFEFGWYDPNLGPSGGETGDQCTGAPLSNIALGSNRGEYVAVQPLWSNTAGGCMLGATPSLSVNPASVNFGFQPLFSGTSDVSLTVSNVGTADLHPKTFRIVGTNASDFSLAYAGCATVPVLVPTIAAPDLSGENQCGPLLVNFTPTALGTRTAAVQITSDDPSSPTLVNLSGVGLSSLFSSIFNGGVVWAQGIHCIVCGTFVLTQLPEVTRQTVPFTNQDTVQHHISGVSLAGVNPGDFAVASDGCTGITLTPGQTCNVVVNFAPLQTGARSARLRINDDAAGSPHQVPIRGTATGAIGQIVSASNSLPISALELGDVHVPGGSSVPRSLTLENTGEAALTISAITADGPFHVITNCPLAPNTLAAGSMSSPSFCSIQVSFTPTQAGSAQGLLTVKDNASDSPQTVKLSGTGVAPFGSFPVKSLSLSANRGSAGTAQVQFHNLGTAPLTISAVTTSGPFSATSTCALTSAPIKGSCTISVTYRPTLCGKQPGSLTVIDNAQGGAQLLPLSGNGICLITGPIGTGQLTPPDGASQVGNPATLTVSWSDPSGWHDLRSLDLQLTDPAGGIALWARFGVGAGSNPSTFSLLDAQGNPVGTGLPGSAGTLDTSTAAMDLTQSNFQGSGPTGPSVTVTVELSFKPPAGGQVYASNLAATNVAGQVEGPQQVGTWTVGPFNLLLPVVFR
jgi:hypothetical protein